jgi:hypothetical protein
MSEAKYRAYILELCGHDWVGAFDTEEKAQTALDRAQFYRVRTNLLLVSGIDVLEEVSARLSVQSRIPTDSLVMAYRQCYHCYLKVQNYSILGKREDTVETVA